jgi:predicted dienelactone hydrolase
MLAAASIAVLGAGVYLVLQATLGHPASAGTTSPPTARTTVPAAPSSSPPPPPLAIGQLGDYQVATRSYTFTEQASGYRRVLRVSVRIPLVPPGTAYTRPPGGTFPLVVFAPGYRQCDTVYRHLLRQWASAGYVVAGVEFPLTNCNVAVPDESDLSNQPADMAFVIKRLLAMSSQPQGPLAGLISAAKIAVAGHSDGGDTVAAMAAASCCRDQQVRAVIVLAGAEWPALPGRWFSAHTPPMLFVQGSADSWNPPAASVQLYQSDTTGIRYFLELFGADHFTPYQGYSAPEPIVARVTLDFLDRFLAGQDGKISAMQQDGHVPGVAELVTGGQLP